MRRQLTGVALLLSLAVAGCGGSSGGNSGKVATAGGAGAGKPEASAPAAADVSDADRQLKFAQCMRENGVDVPDPEPGSRPRLRFGADADQAKVEAAMQKCRQFLPNGGERLKLDPQQVEQMRALAGCMRENGVPDFPDPDPDGRMQVGRNLDRTDPKLQAAFEKCRQFAPQFGGRG